MNNPGLFQAKWNLGRWAFCNLLAIGLLCFWLWPTGQMLCVLFDEWLFHLLNDPLASNSTWLHVWAVASLRPFDAVVGVILLSLLIRGDWVFKAVQVRQALLGFIGILLLLLFIRMLFSKFAVFTQNIRQMAIVIYVLVFQSLENQAIQRKVMCLRRFQGAANTELRPIYGIGHEVDG
jgi:hypothetical protein